MTVTFRTVAAEVPTTLGGLLPGRSHARDHDTKEVIGTD
jgi:hypothetical protein